MGRAVMVSVTLLSSAAGAEVSVPPINSASALLHGFWNRDPRVAELGRRPIQLSGLVAVVRDGHLGLQTDERGYTVQCLNAGVEPLDVGTLVLVEVRAPVERPRGIEVEQCRVLWTERELETRVPTEADRFSFLARSRQLCEVFDERILRSSQSTREIRRLLLRGSSLRAMAQYFVSRGIEPLACDDPLIALTNECEWVGLLSGLEAAPIVEGNTVFFPGGERDSRVGTACGAALVKGVLAAPLEDDAKPEHDDTLLWRMPF